MITQDQSENGRGGIGTWDTRPSRRACRFRHGIQKDQRGGRVTLVGCPLVGAPGFVLNSARVMTCFSSPGRAFFGALGKSVSGISDLRGNDCPALVGMDLR
jgi:hypothetical protein